jgi:diacylglycerol kinase (ATP)
MKQDTIKLRYLIQITPNSERRMTEQRKAIVIHSPTSGNSDQLEQSLQYLREAGLELVNVQSITDLDGLEPQGPQWQKKGIELVISAGGDGLIGGIVSHIVASGLPLGILPLGTANDVARAVHIPMNIQQAVQVIAHGKQILSDVGIAQPAEQKPQSLRINPEFTIPTHTQMYFAHALTIGLNVQFAQLATDKELRQQYGRMTYPLAVVEALRTYQPVELQLSFDGLAIRNTVDQAPTLLTKSVTIDCKVAQATVVNMPIFWGALQATVPGVKLYDGLLDIVLIEDIALDQLLLRVLSFFDRQERSKPGATDWHARYPQLLAAELTNIPGIHHVQAKGITITAKAGRQNATLDGEIRGYTPIHTRVAHERLKLIVPEHTEQTQWLQTELY